MKTNKASTAANYVINPRTQRPVRVNGRIFKQLVSDGVFENVQEANVLADSDDEETIQAQNRRLPLDRQAVKGRGRFKGKVVERRLPRNWAAEESSEDEGDY